MIENKGGKKIVALVNETYNIRNCCLAIIEETKKYNQSSNFLEFLENSEIKP